MDHRSAGEPDAHRVEKCGKMSCNLLNWVFGSFSPLSFSPGGDMRARCQREIGHGDPHRTVLPQEWGSTRLTVEWQEDVFEEFKAPDLAKEM